MQRSNQNRRKQDTISPEVINRLRSNIMKKRNKNRIWAKIVPIVLVCCMAISVCAWADDDKPTIDASVSFMSQYIWRGQELSRDSLIVEPSFTIGYKGFAANVWQNVDTNYWDTSNDADNLNETDTTVSYSHDFGNFGLEIGYIWYSLVQTDDSHEVYASATVNTFLSPTLTVYREFAHAPSTYITLGVSHSIAFPWHGISLDLGLKGSYLISNDKEAYPDPSDPDKNYIDFHDGLLSAALNVPINNYITVSPEVDWSFPLSSDAAKDMAMRNAGHGAKDNFVYAGLSVSLAF